MPSVAWPAGPGTLRDDPATVRGRLPRGIPAPSRIPGEIRDLVVSGCIGPPPEDRGPPLLFGDDDRHAPLDQLGPALNVEEDALQTTL